MLGYMGVELDVCIWYGSGDTRYWYLLSFLTESVLFLIATLDSHLPWRFHLCFRSTEIMSSVHTQFYVGGGIQTLILLLICGFGGLNLCLHPRPWDPLPWPPETSITTCKCLVYVVIKHRDSCMLSKHSFNWATTPPLINLGGLYFFFICWRVKWN